MDPAEPQTPASLIQASPGPSDNKFRDGHHKACDVCKRRKVRCSGTNPCQQCCRSKTVCSYSSNHGKIAALERRLRQSERRVKSLETAWSQFLPQVDLSHAIEASSNDDNRRTTSELPASELSTIPTGDGASGIGTDYASRNMSSDVRDSRCIRDDRSHSPPDLEFDTIEALEWDETVEQNILTDGIGSLSLQTKASGYMGPQSGNALLRHLHSVVHFLSEGEADLDFSSFPVDPETSQETQALIHSNGFRIECLDWYFQHFHKAYPLLHEGFFRAQLMGAIPKPKDGSWAVLCNMVLAVGAFAGPQSSNKADRLFFHHAQSALSMDLLQRGSIHLVQAFLLMANYLQKRNKPNSGFTFLGVAMNMALGLGLHREFSDVSITPFTMEIRRRVWWTLFIFDSGARLTFGRSSILLAGGNVKLPVNLDDSDLAVDNEALGEPRDYPTVTSSLIWQCKLANISNEVNARLLERRLPQRAEMLALDNRVLQWQESLPPFFKQSPAPDHAWFDVPRMILLWRAQHLRIVLTRPFLLDALQRRQPLNTNDANDVVVRCITAAQDCTQSIISFSLTRSSCPGALAWYATYWLVTAVFVSVTCLIYDLHHPSAVVWRGQIENSQKTLQTMAVFEPIAGRAALILSRIMDLVPCSPNSVADLAANDAVRMGITDIWSESWLQVDYQAMSDLVQTVDSNDVEL